MSTSGSVILPCIFDDCDMHIGGEYNFLYKGVNFKLWLYGKINSVEKDSLQSIIDGYDETDAIYCVNGESDFFILYQRELLPEDYKYVRTSKDTKAAVLQKIVSLLSNVVTSKENLQSVLI